VVETPRVDYAFNDEQQMLRETTRRFLDEQVPSAVVRDLSETDLGFDEKLWRLGAELGWNSLAIPEEYGGAGYTFAELGVVLEEMGRSLVPGPFLPTVVMAANAILLAGSEEQKHALLPGIASGASVMTLALFEDPHESSVGSISTTARRDGDDWVLDGAKRNVLDGALAATIVTAAKTDRGPSLFVVPADASGVTREAVATLDATRKQATVSYEGVRVGPDALLGADGSGGPVIEEVLRLTAVAVALEQVGGAQWCLDTAVEHAKTRFQFGRAIGSFQAVKHRCAEMLVAVEHARSTAYHAARVAHYDAEMRIASPLASSICSDGYLQVAGDTIQVLGGTGFTWEHDAHMYFKRAKSSSLMFGSAGHQRRLLAAALGL